MEKKFENTVEELLLGIEICHARTNRKMIEQLVACCYEPFLHQMSRLLHRRDRTVLVNGFLGFKAGSYEATAMFYGTAAFSTGDVTATIPVLGPRT